jgi:DNA repair protein RadC
MDLPYEEFWVLLLNQSNKVIDKVRVSSGGIAGTYVDVRLVLREAILRHATQIAVVHNHPSGNNQPSSEDRSLTQRISKSGETMNIRLLDHVIICESCYYSFADEGTL